jgi:ribosome-binding protein aMBF1 (putative translation factor)
MSEHMKKHLTNINIDGIIFCLPKEDKSAILKLIKSVSVETENPFADLEACLPKYSINLRGARKHLGMSQKQLSLKSGIDISNISKMENGERKIGVSIAKRLAEILKVSPKVFLI